MRKQVVAGFDETATVHQRGRMVLVLCWSDPSDWSDQSDKKYADKQI